MITVDAEGLDPDGGGRRLEAVAVEIRQPAATSGYVVQEETDLSSGRPHATDNPAEKA